MKHGSLKMFLSYFKLAKLLPYLWIHIPVGNANEEEAPKELQSKLKYSFNRDHPINAF